MCGDTGTTEITVFPIPRRLLTLLDHFVWMQQQSLCLPLIPEDHGQEQELQILLQEHLILPWPVQELPLLFILFPVDVDLLTRQT